MKIISGYIRRSQSPYLQDQQPQRNEKLLKKTEKGFTTFSAVFHLIKSYNIPRRGTHE